MAAKLMRAVRAVDKVPVLLADVPVPALRPGEVLLKVAATAVNRGDLSQVAGRYPPPPGVTDVLGLEAAGTVVEANGTALAEGSKAMALLPGGGYAEYVAVPAAHCIPVPEPWSLTEAAAIPEVFLTAYQALLFNGGLGPDNMAGKTVLVHAGASGVGTAASQIVRALGGTVVTTSSEDKVPECLKYATHGVSRTPTEADGSSLVFADKVEAALGKKNAVDLVIDPVFGDQYAAENTRVLAPDGAIVVLAFMGGNKLEQFNCLPLFQKRGRIIFSTLRSRDTDYKARLVEAFRRDVWPHFEAAKAGRPGIVPVIGDTVPMERVADAHGIIGANKITGKCVLSW